MKSNADSLPSNKTLTEVDNASERKKAQKIFNLFLKEKN